MRTHEDQGNPEPAGTAADAVADVPLPATSEAAASVIDLRPGLYVIEIGALPDAPGAAEHSRAADLPAISLSQLPSVNGEAIATLSAAGVDQRWFERAGGVVVVRSPPSGAQLLVTAFARPGQAPIAPRIGVRRLDGASGDEQAGSGMPDGGASGERDRELPIEVLLHIERVGDCVFAGSGWLGERGQRLRIEAFSLTPLEGVSAHDLEYKAFYPGGEESDWVRGRQLCGTRGRALPLTGFAVRLAPHLRGRFDVVYYGSFFNTGIIGPSRNGEPCRPHLAGDPLEALNLRIVELGMT